MRISDWSSDVCSSDLLDPPALVVGEVPMERVELGERHAVDHPLHILDRPEMARRIEHHHTPGACGRLVDRDRGDAAARGRGDEIGRESCRERVWQYL